MLEFVFGFCTGALFVAAYSGNLATTLLIGVIFLAMLASIAQGRRGIFR